MLQRRIDINYVPSGRRGPERRSIRSQIEAIYHVTELPRRAGFHTKTHAAPGHTLQLVREGGLELLVNGMAFDVKDNHIIYFHESDIQELTAGEDGYVLISVSFDAPTIHPLPIDGRVLDSNREIRGLFEKLLSLYPRASKEEDRFELFSMIYRLMGLIQRRSPSLVVEERGNDIWWEIEAWVKRSRRFRAQMKELSHVFPHSSSTIFRSCVKSTGLPPMRRLRAIRMAEARGLIKYAELSVTEIARRLGYPRVHEFSREFSRFFEMAPTTFAKSRK